MALEIISEIHPQHHGRPNMIREMIRLSKQNGATVVKIQLYDVAKLFDQRWKYLEFSEEEVGQIWQWCREEDIELMASVFESSRVDWCERLGVKRYKIASRTVTEDPDLCKEILDKGKETIVSLGAWVNFSSRRDTKPFGVHDQIKYLYCKSKYPALLEDMSDFPKDFMKEGLAGYSDHTLGIDCCLLAISLGASIIEKHFTTDKSFYTETEKAHICSMTAAELKDLSYIGGSLYRTRKAIYGG